MLIALIEGFAITALADALVFKATMALHANRWMCGQKVELCMGDQRKTNLFSICRQQKSLCFQRRNVVTCTPTLLFSDTSRVTRLLDTNTTQIRLSKLRDAICTIVVWGILSVPQCTTKYSTRFACEYNDHTIVHGQSRITVQGSGAQTHSFLWKACSSGNHCVAVCNGDYGSSRSQN